MSDDAREYIADLQAAIHEKDEALREALEWIEADEGFATDFPEEWERLTAKIRSAIND